MSRVHISLSVLMCVLLCQLSHLSVSVSIPTVIYGTVTHAEEASVAALPRTIHEATFLAQTDDRSSALVFVGDILLARNVEILMRRYTMQYPFKNVVFSRLYENPLGVGNFEASVPRIHQPTPPLAMRFSVPESSLSSLSEAGFTHLSLANNHSHDYGPDAFSNTEAIFRAANLTPFGNGTAITQSSVTYIPTRLGRIALMGINASEVIPNRTELAELFAATERNSDVQIVYIHWGNEYESLHNTSQRTLAKALVTAGADLIIGHHPHVVQDVDIIDGVLVFYSLGNFIFDQYFSPEVQTGLVVALEFNDVPQLRLFPVSSIGSLSQPSLLEGAQRHTFLKHLAKASHATLHDDISTGVVPLSALVATSQKTAIMVR